MAEDTKTTQEQFYDRIKKAIKNCDRFTLGDYLEPEKLKKEKISEDDPEIQQAKEILGKLNNGVETFQNDLASYLVNQILIERFLGSDIVFKGENIYLYHVCQGQDSNPYILSNTICRLMSQVFKDSISYFHEIYTSKTPGELTPGDLSKFTKPSQEYKFTDHWKKKPRKDKEGKITSGGTEWTLNSDGKKLKKYDPDYEQRRLAHWKGKLSQKPKSTKLSNQTVLTEELYCHYYKFWNEDNKIPCQPVIDTEARQHVFGYIGQSGLLRLSQQLKDDRCPSLYPMRTYSQPDNQEKTAIEQAVDAIHYLNDNDSKIGVPDGKMSLEEGVSKISREIGKDIYLIDTSTVCTTANPIWNPSEMYRPEKGQEVTVKNTETIFLYVYRNEEGIDFIEPIVFININSNLADKDKILTKRLPNTNPIVKNLANSLPECDEGRRSATPSVEKPSSTPSTPTSDELNPVVANPDDLPKHLIIPEMKKVPTTPIMKTPQEVSSSLGSKDLAYYNINDIGETLPIVAIGVDRSSYLMGNEYIIDGNNYRNLYDLDFPYNIKGRLSGLINTGQVMISWTKTTQESKSKTTIAQHGGKTLYDCLDSNNVINSTPFYQILENTYKFV